MAMISKFLARSAGLVEVRAALIGPSISGTVNQTQEVVR